MIQKFVIMLVFFFFFFVHLLDFSFPYDRRLAIHTKRQNSCEDKDDKDESVAFVKFLLGGGGGAEEESG